MRRAEASPHRVSIVSNSMPRLTSATVQALPRCERTRLKKLASKGLRVATMNVGTLTRREREWVELMKRRRVRILCVQVTRWKKNRAKELGEGYKLYYSAATTEGINGVGIIVSEKIKQYVTEVKREGDRLMVLRLVYWDCPINIVSAYAPQTGLPEEVKEEFWVDVERVIGRIRHGGASYSGSRFERTHRNIRWTGLRNPEKSQEFKTKVLNRLTTTEKRVQGWWENNASVLRNVAREVLGETSGIPRT